MLAQGCHCNDPCCIQRHRRGQKVRDPIMLSLLSAAQEYEHPGGCGVGIAQFSTATVVLLPEHARTYLPTIAA